MPDQLSSDLASLKIVRDQSPPRSGWLRGLIVAAVLGGVAVGGYVLGKPYLESRLFKQEIAVTEIALISPAQAKIELTSTGYVVPQRVSRVGPKLPGRIASLHVREGQQVKAGDIIAEMEAADSEAALRAAKSRMLASKAQVAKARADLAELGQRAKRERSLANKGVAPSAGADDLEAQLESRKKIVKAAQAQVKAAQADVESLEVNLGYMKITAPIDGTVVNKPAEAGELVGPQAGALAEIADFTSLMVETDVPEGRLHLVQIDGPAEIVLDAFPGNRYRGKVNEITPRVNRAKATVTVKVGFIDPVDSVLPDMAARVSFLTEELEPEAMKEPPKLVVPAAAIADRGGAKVVFVLEEGTVRMTPITLGPQFSNGFELEAGPPAGTRLVRDPSANLKDGQSVKEASDS